MGPKSSLATLIDKETRLGGVDFHLHSIFSDGSASPREVVEMARAANLRYFSLTDHDSVRGNHLIEEELLRLERAGHYPLPLFIPGLELSLFFRQEEIHLLVYFADGLSLEKIKVFLRETVHSREQRNRQMLHRLNNLGIPIRYESLEALAENKPGRVHMALWLIRHGYALDVNDAFARYLGRDGKAYIPRERHPAEAAFAFLNSLDVASFLAHPQEYSWGQDKELIFSYFQELKAMGLDGVEVFHGEAGKEERDLYFSASEKLSLYLVAGSDWHGKNKENRPHYTGDSRFIGYSYAD